MKTFPTAIALLLLVGSVPATALSPVVERGEAILVIGASFESGGTPCTLNPDGTGVENNALFCTGVNFGAYLPLAAALQNRLLVRGQVINEAIGGATTFPRGGYPAINPDGSIPGEEDKTPFGWEQHGFNQQLVRALGQVINPFIQPPAVNARYVVIGVPNDCQHSSAFAIAPADTVPDQCSLVNPESGKTGLEEVVDRLIGLGQAAIASGLTPIYTGYPPYVTGTDTGGINLGVAQATFGFPWVMSEASYNSLVADYESRIPATLGASNVIMADAWSPGYEHLGDGLHPTPEVSELAALRIVLAILQFENP